MTNLICNMGFWGYLVIIIPVGIIVYKVLDKTWFFKGIPKFTRYGALNNNGYCFQILLALITMIICVIIFSSFIKCP